MYFLFTSFLVALAHLASSEGTYKTKAEASQPSYQTAYQPYSYQPYAAPAIPNYGYDSTYSSRYGSYGSYPASHDLSSQHLVLSGGIFRPYEYSDDYDQNSGYKPYSYDNTYKYYNTPDKYVKYSYGNRGAVYY